MRTKTAIKFAMAMFVVGYLCGIGTMLYFSQAFPSPELKDCQSGGIGALSPTPWGVNLANAVTRLNRLFAEEATRIGRPPLEELQKQVCAESWFNWPINYRDGQLHGNSRAWGDVSDEVRQEVIRLWLIRCLDLKFSEEVARFELVKVFIESGFNPDAAAPTSSACGPSQYINKTRHVLCARARISAENPFDLKMHLALMPYSLKEGWKVVSEEAQSKPAPWKQSDLGFYARLYGYHHDGPSFSSGGTRIGQECVVPLMKRAKQVLAAGE
jgi:hypothetical protein